MKATGFGVMASTRPRRQAEADRADRLRCLAFVAVLVAFVWWLGLCGVGRAESGTTHRGVAPGLTMDIDTRWLSGAGYRPVRITVTPTAPVIADRTLTVEFSARQYWNRGRDDFRVVQDIEIPAGSGPIQTTLSVPETLALGRYTINVLEDGQVQPRLCQSGSGDDYTLWAWEAFPKVLILGDDLPDTSGMAALLNASEYYQYQSSQPPTSSAGAKMPLPTAMARPATEVPRRWIDYTNLDLICLSAEQLAALGRQQPEAFRAMLEWAFAGGNLCVYGVGQDWGRLPELESLVGLRPGTADTASGPAARGWTEPEEKLFGRVIRGVGSNATDPFVASPCYKEAEQLLEDVEREREPPREPVRPAECFRFVFREFNLGMIVAVADDDVFDVSFPQGSHGWSWILNSIGSKRFLWYQRHGLSAARENDDFWNFLIPGVGLAPVTGFRVLITLFVLGIGPLNYYLLRRWKSLHFLVVTVPLSATAVTLALFGYAMVADGLGTRVRVRSVTRIDQRRGHAACWSRLSYYAGLAPAGGLTFPADVAVMAFEYRPGEEESRTRELIWENDQWLSSGWLSSRTPTQFITVRSRPTDLGLAITESEGRPGVVQVKNRLGTSIQQLLVRATDGRYFWAGDVEPGGTTDALPIEPDDAQGRLQRTFHERRPALPAGMDRRGATGYFGWRSYRRPWRWVSSQAALPPARQATSVLETSLGVRAANMDPASYVAVVERSPEVVLGTPSAREEAALHVIVGTW